MKNGGSLRVHMLLGQFEKNRLAIKEIGREAADRGHPVGLSSSWADNDYAHQRSGAGTVAPQEVSDQASGRHRVGDLKTGTASVFRKF
jgi:hypothetical protein